VALKILYFSGYEWGNLGRRKVRLAYEFAQRPEVASLLYVEPPVQTSLLDVARGRFLPSHLGQDRRAHLKALLNQPCQVEGKVWVYTGSQKTIPLTRLRALRGLEVLQRLNQALYIGGIRRLLKRLPGDELVLWLTYPLQAWALDAFPQRVLACYDWTDDWLQFDPLPMADRDAYAALNERALRETDVVFAVSQSLCERALRVNACTAYAPNATDYRVLSMAADLTGPLAPEVAEMPPPRLGYIGQMGDRFDFGLIEALAQAHPTWSFILVGPVWINRQDWAARLARCRNVRLAGQQPFGRLPQFLRGFDVCLIPHEIGALTNSMDPIKLYDYMAPGKPIVSTPVAGVDRFEDVVYIANGAEGFAAAVEQALSENGAQRARRQEYARQHTWETRAAQMWTVFQDRLREVCSDQGQCHHPNF
jgi:glycosyltransferase involved in cell wall biosynthesis